MPPRAPVMYRNQFSNKSAFVSKAYGLTAAYKRSLDLIIPLKQLRHRLIPENRLHGLRQPRHQ
jgi:hypothetical protein